MSDKTRKKRVEGENIFTRPGKSGKGETVEIKPEPKYTREHEKITVEIREVVRIKPQDFAALKSSFEDWAVQWD